MSLLYDRRSSITLQEVTSSGAGSKKKLSTNPALISGFDPMAPLRTRFEIESTIQPEPNQGKIEVWGLNAEHRAAVQKDFLLTLRAGYAGDAIDPLGLPMIARGNLSNVLQTKESVGWKSTFQIGDGGAAFKTGKINDLVPKDTSVVEVFERIRKRIEELGVEVQSDFAESILHWITSQWRKATSTPSSEGTDTGGDAILKTPKAIVGKLSDILTQETDRINLSWSVQKGVLVIRPKGGSDAQPAIILTPTTGLLGSPERDERGGVTGRALIIPGLDPGRKIQIESRVISGEYVIAKMKTTGDTHGPAWWIDWEAFIEGTEIKI